MCVYVTNELRRGAREREGKTEGMSNDEEREAKARDRRRECDLEQKISHLS